MAGLAAAEREADQRRRVAPDLDLADGGTLTVADLLATELHAQLVTLSACDAQPAHVTGPAADAVRC